MYYARFTRRAIYDPFFLKQVAWLDFGNTVWKTRDYISWDKVKVGWHSCVLRRRTSVAPAWTCLLLPALGSRGTLLVLSVEVHRERRSC